MSQLYVKAAERLLNAALAASAPVAGTLKIALVANSYAQNLSADEFYTSISAHVVGTPQALASLSFTGGKVDASDPVITGVAAAQTCEAAVVYMDTGVAGTSWLLAYIDDILGFPLTTTGADVTLAVDNGTFRLFSLVP